MTYLKKFLLALVLLMVGTFAQAAPPTAQALDQSASKFIQTESNSPEGFVTLDFLKTAKRQKYVSIDKYMDADSFGGIQSKILGIFIATDSGKQIPFGILFDSTGKSEKFVTLTASKEALCIPYFISNEKSFNVYYTPKNSSSLASLLEARNNVLAALIETLKKQNLLSGRERVVASLTPNNDPYEPQDKLRIEGSLRLRQSLIVNALKNVKVVGAENVFANIELSGNPAQDPFNPQYNATCTEVK